MPEAAACLGMSSDSVRRALQNAGVKLQRINARAWAVDEKDVKTFADRRESYAGRGRPVGTTGIKKTKRKAASESETKVL